MNMDRNEAIVMIRQHVRKDTLFKHMLATEAIMRGIAEYLGKDKELWAMTGLVHDIDFEECKPDWSDHGVKCQAVLRGKVPEESLKAILAHNFEKTGVQPKADLEIALLCADALTGLIISAALVKDKKLSNVTKDKLANVFKKKGFAAGSNRDHIRMCEQIGIPLETFFETGLKSMQAIATDLGL